MNLSRVNEIYGNITAENLITFTYIESSQGTEESRHYMQPAAGHMPHTILSISSLCTFGS
jgi:hypothetical protein